MSTDRSWRPCPLAYTSWTVACHKRDCLLSTLCACTPIRVPGHGMIVQTPFPLDDSRGGRRWKAAKISAMRVLINANSGGFLGNCTLNPRLRHRRKSLSAKMM